MVRLSITHVGLISRQKCKSTIRNHAFRLAMICSKAFFFILLASFTLNHSVICVSYTQRDLWGPYRVWSVCPTLNGITLSYTERDLCILHSAWSVSAILGMICVSRSKRNYSVLYSVCSVCPVLGIIYVSHTEGITLSYTESDLCILHRAWAVCLAMNVICALLWALFVSCTERNLCRLH